MDAPPADEEAEKKEEAERQNLFQVLLRDLEIEGVPLLGIAGVMDTNTVQAALWTVASQLSENTVASKACLIFEDFLAGAASETNTDTTEATTNGMAQLKALVATYTQDVLTNEATTTATLLPELQRFTVDLVGKGLGPALTVATVNRTQTDHVEYTERRIQHQQHGDEILHWEPAIQAFLQRFGKELLQQDGEDTTTPTTTTNPNIAYTYVESSDICDLMAGYWNCICELLVTEEDQTQQQGVNTIVLAYPPPPQATITRRRAADSSAVVSEEQQRQHEHDQHYYHERFVAITALLNVMNTLVVVTPSKRSNSHTNSTETPRSVLPPFELIHLHPLYDRSKMTRTSTSGTKEEDGRIPDNGHLPAFEVLQAAFATEAVVAAEAELAVLNYQRRSPVPAVIIQRRKPTTTTMSPVRESWQRLLAIDGGESTLQHEFADEVKLLYHRNPSPDEEPPQPQ